MCQLCRIAETSSVVKLTGPRRIQELEPLW